MDSVCSNKMNGSSTTVKSHSASQHLTSSYVGDLAKDGDTTLIFALKDKVGVLTEVLNSMLSLVLLCILSFNWCIIRFPTIRNLMMACWATASLLLYFVPLRYITLAWGINKFTKKLRNPNAVDNNELIDFLSRVPDGLQCFKVKNTISY